jgi:uncharacterized membrane protein YczE
MRIGVKRFLMMLSGVFFTACTVGLFNYIQLGPDPFTVFVNGTANLLHTSYGTVYPFINLLLLLLALWKGKNLIGIATLFNIFLTGMIADFVRYHLDLLLGEQPLWIRIFLLLGTLILLCLSSSLYMVADLGVSAYDAAAILLSRMQKKISFRFCRIGTDVLCVITGLLCHTTVGIGTLVTAFFMGPVIQFFNTHISIPLLYGRNQITRGKKDEV